MPAQASRQAEKMTAWDTTSAKRLRASSSSERRRQAWLRSSSRARPAASHARPHAREIGLCELRKIGVAEGLSKTRHVNETVPPH